jgi:ubiquinone/menaquinone biosynthesis C-methylase UbiE
MPPWLSVPLKILLKTAILRLVTTPLNAYLLPFIPFQRRDNSYVILQAVSAPRAVAAADLPVPPVALRSSYGPTTQAYLASGEQDVARMLALLATTGWAIQPGARVLELGCAAGRMLRWLAPYAATCELWGTDVSAAHINWCQSYLGSQFSCFTGTTLPHLPFPDAMFDCIYAGSVFTHIDDLADAWLLELRRILRPGGRLYLTIHDQHTIALLSQRPDHPLAQHLYAHRAYRQWSHAPFGKFTIGRAYNSQVFYDITYLRERTQRYLDLVCVQPEAYGYQTAVIFQPK